MSIVRFPARPRHRPLLLPRGWVALGFLALLGCSVLARHPTLRRYSVLQLTMLPRHPDPARPLPPLPTITQVKAMRRYWLTSTFTGRRRSDSLVWRLTQQRLRAQRRLPSRLRGVCVRFERRARYASLVDVLDELSVLNARRYALDVQGPVAALYVLDYAPPEAVDSDFAFGPAPAGPDRAARWLKQVGAPLQQAAWGPALLASVGVGALAAALGAWLRQ